MSLSLMTTNPRIQRIMLRPWIVLAGFFFLLGFSPLAFAEQIPFVGEVVGDKESLRAGQNSAFEKIAQIRKGQMLTVVGESYGWYKVKLPADAVSFVKAEFVKEIGGGLGEVAGTRVNIRCAPNTKASVLGQLQKGELIRLLDKKEDWFQIEAVDRSFGWLRSDLIVFRSKEIPPSRQMTLADRKDSPEDMASQAAVEKKSDIVSGTGVIEDLADKAVSTEIRHRLLVDEKTVYFLQGYRRVLDGFLNQKVDVQGTRQSSAGTDQPVLLVTKITLVL